MAMACVSSTPSLTVHHHHPDDCGMQWLCDLCSGDRVGLGFGVGDGVGDL
jgi:hypothetical protein|uniref:Uncharacterized protein n=1 Tax=Fagus sylvatica TaxID=28930 RepID=A0A2N9J133_FAGSY